MIITGPLQSAFAALFGSANGLSIIGLVFEGWLSVIGRIATLIATVLVTAIKGLIGMMADVADKMADLISKLPAAARAALALAGTTEASMRESARGLRAARDGITAAQNGAQANGRPRTDVSAVGGAFETATDLFKRINESAIKTNAQQQIDLLQQIRDNTAREGAQTILPIVTPQGVQLPSWMPSQNQNSPGINAGLAAVGLGGAS